MKKFTESDIGSPDFMDFIKKLVVLNLTSIEENTEDLNSFAKTNFIFLAIFKQSLLSTLRASGLIESDLRFLFGKEMENFKDFFDDTNFTNEEIH